MFLNCICLLDNISLYFRNNFRPVEKSNFQMVSSPDKKALYAISGHNGINFSYDIYKFNCSGAINTCNWSKSETTIEFARSGFVAILIPNSLADKICPQKSFFEKIFSGFRQ